MTKARLNSITGLLLTISLILHMAMVAVSYIAQIYIPLPIQIFSESTIVICVLHIILSISRLHSDFDRKPKGGKDYMQYNKMAIIQRASGMIIIALLFLTHMRSFEFLKNHDPISQLGLYLRVISQTLFFLIVSLHSAISLPKALLGLGIVKNDQQEKRARILAAVIFIFLFLLCEYGIMIFLVNWPRV